MGEGKRTLRTLGAGNNYSHLLSLLDDDEKFVNVDLVDLNQKPEAEPAPDHRGGREYPLFSLVESLEPASDDQAHVIRNVDFVDLDIGAELAGCIEDFPLFDQMSVHLLDEERISLAFLKDKAEQSFRSFALA